MSIQSNINQMWSILGVLTSQSRKAAVGRQKAIDEYEEAKKAQSAEEQLAEDIGYEPEQRTMDTIAAQKEKGYPLSEDREKGYARAAFALEKERSIRYAAAAKKEMELAPSEKTQEKYLRAQASVYENEEAEKRTLSNLQKQRDLADQERKFAAEQEQARLAKSREITRMITEGIHYSPESQAYINKRLGGSN